jgi:hypothetical protein
MHDSIRQWGAALMALHVRIGMRFSRADPRWGTAALERRRAECQASANHRGAVGAGVLGSHEPAGKKGALRPV